MENINELTKAIENSWLWYKYDSMDNDEVHDKDSYVRGFIDGVEWIKSKLKSK